MLKVVKLFLVFVMVFNVISPSFAKSYGDRVMDKKYREALSVGCEHVKAKKPVTAAILALLPGGGAFYTRQVGLGVVDILFWPFSPIWEIPLVLREAKKINKEETIYVCEDSGKL